MRRRPGCRRPGGRRAAGWVAAATAARRSILGVHGRRAAERIVRWAARAALSDESTMDEVLEQLRSIMAAVGDRTRTAGQVAEVIRDARGYRWVGLYDVGAGEIVAVGWTGGVAPAFPRFPIDRGLNGAAARAARPVVVQDVSSDSRYLTTFGSTGAEAIFPVVSPTGEVIGTIDAESDRENAFTADDDAFLSECARVLLPLWISPQR